MPALINTILMTAFSLAIATPLGIFAAVWLVEMGDTERLFSTPVDKRTEDYISGRFG